MTTADGSALTLENVKLIHVEYSSRGNDALQLNGSLKVIGSLEIEMGSNIRYYRERGSESVPDGFTNRAWGGISFNNGNCSIDFTQCTSFKITDGFGTAKEGEDAYGLTQAPIHILSESDYAKVVGWENVGLVKIQAQGSWPMSGYAFADLNAAFLERNGYTLEDGVYTK